MLHLIAEAKDIANQIRDTKPPKQLYLLVHKDNVAAQKVCQRLGFEILDRYEINNHLVMSHKLNLGWIANSSLQSQ